MVQCVPAAARSRLSLYVCVRVDPLPFSFSFFPSRLRWNSRRNRQDATNDVASSLQVMHSVGVPGLIPGPMIVSAAAGRLMNEYWCKCKTQCRYHGKKYKTQSKYNKRPFLWCCTNINLVLSESELNVFLTTNIYVMYNI